MTDAEKALQGFQEAIYSRCIDFNACGANTEAGITTIVFRDGSALDYTKPKEKLNHQETP